MQKNTFVVLSLLTPLAFFPAAGAEDSFISTCTARGQFRASCTFTCVPGATLLLHAAGTSDFSGAVVGVAECGGAVAACEHRSISLPGYAQCVEMSPVLSLIAATGRCLATGVADVYVYCASSA